MTIRFLPIVPSGDNGGISDCERLAPVCGYHCCHQLLPENGAIDPAESILLFPGEHERASEAGAPPAGHIRITEAGPHGGRYGYCDPEIIDQRSCHASRNFKPLDCRSYPLFPAMADGKLSLLIDTRCPISAERRSRLREHARWVLGAWQAEVDRDPAVAHWLMGISLPTYEPFVLDAD